MIQSRLFPVLTLASGLLFAATQAWGQETTPQSAAQKFGTLLRYIDQLYVDSVDLDDLMETAVIGMLEELDPHSV